MLGELMRSPKPTSRNRGELIVRGRTEGEGGEGEAEGEGPTYKEEGREEKGVEREGKGFLQIQGE